MGGGLNPVADFVSSAAAWCGGRGKGLDGDDGLGPDEVVDDRGDAEYCRSDALPVAAKYGRTQFAEALEQFERDGGHDGHDGGAEVVPGVLAADPSLPVDTGAFQFFADGEDARSAREQVFHYEFSLAFREAYKEATECEGDCYPEIRASDG